VIRAPSKNRFYGSFGGNCRTRIAMGVVEAINGNIKTLLRRGRGYKNLPIPGAQGPMRGGQPDGIPHHQEWPKMLLRTDSCA
jgi:hypothetical protein